MDERAVEDSLMLLQARVERIEAILVILIEDRTRYGIGGGREMSTLNSFVDAWRARHS